MFGMSSEDTPDFLFCWYLIIQTSKEFSEFYMVKENKKDCMPFQHTFFGTYSKVCSKTVSIPSVLEKYAESV